MILEKSMRCLVLACILLAPCLPGKESRAPLRPPNAARLMAVQQKDGCLILEGENKVFFYQRTPRSLEGKFARANYLHPLYDLDGNILTEDFPKDHLHHRGVFWAWHQLSVGEKKVGDSWMAEDFSWDVQDITISNPDRQSIALKARVLWKSPLWLDRAGRQKPLVEEVTTITVHSASQEARAIDFHIRLLALEDDMAIGGSDDEKGYGGFALRIGIPDKVQFMSRSGAVEPKITAVEAGPWMDISGNLGESGKPAGVAILSHPSLPLFPPPWILRKSPGMQNAAWPGRRPVPLSAIKPLNLRYRLIIHRGDSIRARIDQLQAEYEK